MVELYVDEGVVVWVQPGGPERFEDVDGVAALARCVAQVKARASWFEHKTIRVWLSGTLARPFVVEPVKGLRSVAEAQALAESLAPAATGLVGPCAVSLEAVPLQRSALATAIERRRLDALTATLCGHGCVARSIRPWWARAVSDLLWGRSPPGLVCVIEPAVATLLAGSGPSLAITVAPAPEPQVQALVRRVCVGQGIDVTHAAAARLDFDRWAGGQPRIERSVLSEVAA